MSQVWPNKQTKNDPTTTTKIWENQSQTECVILPVPGKTLSFLRQPLQMESWVPTPVWSLSLVVLCLSFKLLCLECLDVGAERTWRGAEGLEGAGCVLAPVTSARHPESEQWVQERVGPASLLSLLSVEPSSLFISGGSRALDPRGEQAAWCSCGNKSRKTYKRWNRESWMNLLLISDLQEVALMEWAGLQGSAVSGKLGPLMKQRNTILLIFPVNTLSITQIH